MCSATSGYCHEHGKIGYDSEQAALKTLRHLRRRPGYAPSAHAYRCRYCKQWHIGRSASDIKRRKI